ncbi:class 2 pheromone receptor like protein, partial [Dothistroma septosporum NZE10]
MLLTMDTTPTNTSFDPYNQVLTLVNPDGVTGTDVSIATIFMLQQALLEMASVYGVHVGVTTVLILLLALLTKADKRRSVVFALNMAALVAFWIRAILMLVNAGGPLLNYYNWCLGIYDNLGNAFNISIAAEIIGWLSLAAVELSLLFQVRIVCCTLRQRYRFFLAVGSAVVVLVTMAARFALAVLNIVWTMTVNGASEEKVAKLNKVQFGSTVCTLCSILIFSMAFCAKLGHAIYQRRKIGMKQFGPMQIIFVMGCQTLLIPGLFGVISFFYLRNSQVYTIMPLLVAVFLPLSAIWASTNTAKN